MLRLFLGIMGMGGVLCFIGYQEYEVSRNTAAEPEPVNLVKLEYGIAPPNNHIEIGEHMAVYEALVCAYDESRFGSDEPGPETRVAYVYYPIISLSHPFLKTPGLAPNNSESLYHEDGSLRLDKFNVIVKSNRFGNVSDLPLTRLQKEKGVKGLVVNRISSLGSEERELLQESFPKLNLDEVIILQENRKPSSSSTSFAMMGGDGLLVLVGGALLFAGRAF